MPVAFKQIGHQTRLAYSVFKQQLEIRNVTEVIVKGDRI
jgi:hypothetical protein